VTTFVESALRLMIVPSILPTVVETAPTDLFSRHSLESGTNSLGCRHFLAMPILSDFVLCNNLVPHEVEWVAGGMRLSNPVLIRRCTTLCIVKAPKATS
jgi:hypothetical protein